LDVCSVEAAETVEGKSGYVETSQRNSSIQLVHFKIRTLVKHIR
jgi:hypothetical protein